MRVRVGVMVRARVRDRVSLGVTLRVRIRGLGCQFRPLGLG